MVASVRANDDFSRASLADQVQGALREEIITGRLAPNQRIDSGHYATLWSISQTPLREAIKQLESLGFVQVSPRRGVFVAALDRTALREIFELRIAMECAAAHLATKNIPIVEARNALTLYTDAQVRPDDERAKRLPAIDLLIHDLAVKYCGNRRLQRLMDSINDLVRWSDDLIRKLADIPTIRRCRNISASVRPSAMAMESGRRRRCRIICNSRSIASTTISPSSNRTQLGGRARTGKQ